MDGRSQVGTYQTRSATSFRIELQFRQVEIQLTEVLRILRHREEGEKKGEDKLLELLRTLRIGERIELTLPQGRTLGGSFLGVDLRLQSLELDLDEGKGVIKIQLSAVAQLERAPRKKKKKKKEK